MRRQLFAFFLALLPLPSPAVASVLAPDAVGAAIAERRSRVAELKLVREAAEELGIRVWLFGGTAAGFAHYVRWDLAREAGDSRYRDTFFDYDFTNIYRSTQDADLVVDATPAQAAQLEGLVREKMSFLQGSKEHWEVRLLRQDRVARGGQVKQALLHNPDFLGQHTDSNSTGMIELTDPPPGESVVRDLRDWESATPFFLKDVTEGRLHYYWSPTHRETSRFRAGDNPELFSVIRYLVKAFQYDLQVEGEDLARVQAIIDAFDPQRDHPSMSPWAKGWLERYGPNLIRHSVNIEYAWNTLEVLGLRKKLIALSDPSKEKTLGWWLSREPLRTRSLGEGGGRTASELGIDLVAHETSDFLAYESITRDTTLRPNVLISRPDHPGESAVHGPGFYTLLGRSGARRTGLTIRFRVDPNAREGADFTLRGEVIRFTNRAALRVIPESLQVTWPQYLQMLLDGVINPRERGAWMKLRRRLALREPTPEDEEGMVAVVRAEIDRLDRKGLDPSGARTSQVLPEWFALPISQNHPELVDELAGAVSHDLDRVVGTRTDRRPGFDTNWHLLLLEQWVALPIANSHPELVERLRVALTQAIDRSYQDDFQARKAIEPLARAWFALPPAKADLTLLLTLIDRYWAPGPRLYPSWPSTIWILLQARGWYEQPGLIPALLDRKMFGEAVEVLTNDLQGWATHPEGILELIGRLPTDQLDYELEGLLRVDSWKAEPRLRSLCGGNDPRVGCLRAALRAQRRAMAEQVADGAGRLSGTTGSDLDCREGP